MFERLLPVTLLPLQRQREHWMGRGSPWQACPIPTSGPGKHPSGSLARPRVLLPTPTLPPPRQPTGTQLHLRASQMHPTPNLPPPWLLSLPFPICPALPPRAPAPLVLPPTIAKAANSGTPTPLPSLPPNRTHHPSETSLRAEPPA